MLTRTYVSGVLPESILHQHSVCREADTPPSLSERTTPSEAPSQDCTEDVAHCPLNRLDMQDSTLTGQPVQPSWSPVLTNRSSSLVISSELIVPTPSVIRLSVFLWDSLHRDVYQSPHKWFLPDGGYRNPSVQDTAGVSREHIGVRRPGASPPFGVMARNMNATSHPATGLCDATHNGGFRGNGVRCRLRPVPRPVIMGKPYQFAEVLRITAPRRCAVFTGDLVASDRFPVTVGHSMPL